jgi:hypothetical protein
LDAIVVLSVELLWFGGLLAAYWRFLGFLCSNRLPGGRVTFFAAAKKVTKESRSCVPPGPFLSLPLLRFSRGPGVASALLRSTRDRLPCDPCFLAYFGNGPLRLTPARCAAGVGWFGQPAVNCGNDLARPISLIVIRPYLGWRFDGSTHTRDATRQVAKGFG